MRTTLYAARASVLKAVAQITMNSLRAPRIRTAWLVAVAALLFVSPAVAQISTSEPAPPAALPDDPSTLLQTPTPAEQAQKFPDPGTPPTRRQANAERTASLHLKYIPAGWKVLPLTRQDKVLLGLKDLYSPISVGTYVVSAGYSHLTNGQPNFGTDGNAFAQRFGAAFVRDSSEGIFTDAVFAPLLHEDPRYYVEGSHYSLVHRTLYAITRPLITRTDSGRSTPNGALLLGYAGASALSYTYYPRSNRNFHDTAATFGGGIGGAALGFAITEFTSPLLQKLHMAPR
jgi:hypothetical protein